MTNRNKFNIVAISVYVLLLILFAFLAKYITNLNLAIANKITSNTDSINMVSNILYYVESGIFFIGLGVMVFICLIGFSNDGKSNVLYSFLFSFALVILSTLIKSFIIDINIYKELFNLLFVGIGIGIELLVKVIQDRKGIKNEK